ncbi:hypothetical protein [Nocardioides euryhalodurans]|uniref:hypothetical protein n=1 Tax=Nocardioides euryhalodurans TaxID=2518370 RepID=UPI001ABDE086|nr:hypothetical protein [Nocardioides euryhalodurans]
MPGSSTAPHERERALVDHLRDVAPWGVDVDVTTEATGSPFRARTDGPAYDARRGSMKEACGLAARQPRGRGGRPRL